MSTFSPKRPKRRHVRAAVLLIGMAVSLSLISMPAHAHPEHRRYKKLVRDGVKIKVLAQVIRFRGLVKGGAPLVVDFKLASDGFLKLELKTRNVKRRKTLEFPAKAGARELAIETIPADFGTWQTARMTISAVDESGQQIDFRFFGVGAGERAVGSTAIYNVTFEPLVIRELESANWGFWSHHDFERSEIVIYREEEVDGYRQERAIRAQESPCLPRRNDICEGEWDARDDKGTRSVGSYRVQVKAWQSEEGKDWITELSDDVVMVE